MKKTVIIIVLFFMYCEGFPQSIEVFVKSESHNKQIDIYNDELSEMVIHTIMEDTVFEPWYSLTIYEDSPLRFKVGIATFDDVTRLTGWIDKKHCGVYLRIYEEDHDIIRLYNAPTEQSSCEEHVLGTGYHEVWVIGADIKSGFLNVAFKEEDRLCTGWTKQYCSDYIAGCE